MTPAKESICSGRKCSGFLVGNPGTFASKSSRYQLTGVFISVGSWTSWNKHLSWIGQTIEKLNEGMVVREKRKGRKKGLKGRKKG
jgi:hypothetical protein